MKIAISLLSALSVIPAYASKLPDPKTTSYLCSASYLTRKVVAMKSSDSNDVFKNLETTVVSSISTDFGNSISGGGGMIMGGKMERDPDGSIVEDTLMLVDPRGLKLEPIGNFDNGYANIKKDKISYEFNVQFYPDGNSAQGKNVGPEFRIKGEGSQIAEVKKNEFIQVSCNFVRKLKYRD